MIKRTTARTLALLLALLSVFLFLSGCAKKPEPIMYDDEFQDFAQEVRMHVPYATLFEIIPYADDGNYARQKEVLIPCIVEIRDVIPPEELSLYSNHFGELNDFAYYSIVYHAKVVFDFAAGAEVSKDILYRQDGQIDWQHRGDPPYRPGDRFFTLLTIESEYGTRGSYYGANSRYDLYEEDNEQVLYRRSVVSPELAGLQLPLAEEVRTRITTTTKNPAVYGEKFRLADFSAFVVEDLKERGLLASTENITERTALLTANSRQTEVLPESFPTESTPAAATEGGDLS